MNRQSGMTITLAALLSTFTMGSAQAEVKRLDHDVNPLSQRVDLSLDAQEATYEGRVIIELDIVKSTQTFRLHAEEMDLTDVILKKKWRKFDVKTEVIEGGQVLFTSEKPLKPGKYQLEIAFSNDYNKSPFGLYKVEDEGLPFLFTQFEADDARQAFPCFDEPEFKIPFAFTLRVPKGHLAVTNGPEISRRDEGEWVVIDYGITPPVPSYALAIATGPFATVPIEGLSVPGQIYMTPGKEERAAYALAISQTVLGAMEGYFGSEYPYEKLDFIAVPNFWPGAMENPGAVTYKEGILLLDPEHHTVSDKATLAYIMSHEIAHMWFGNLVTMEWWDDLWLNEAFATWMGRKIRQQEFPDLNSTHGLKSILHAMNSDSNPTSVQIRVPVETDAAFETTNWLVYSKGHAILQMFEQWIGEAAFQKGVRLYVENNRWGNAQSGDLWAALSEAANQDISPAMLTFLEQPGVPLIHIEAENGGLKLRQERMFITQAEDRSFDPWHIPLTVKYKDAAGVHTSQMMFTEVEGHMALDLDGPLEWVLPAVDGVGYYRWNPSETLTRNLVKAAPDMLSKEERVVLLNNLGALTQAGELSAGTMMSLLKDFSSDSDPEVLETVITLMGEYGGEFLPESLKPAYATYLRDALNPALERIGIQPKAEDNGLTLRLRSNLIGQLATVGEDPKIKEAALEMAEIYLKDSSAFDGYLGATLLAIYAREGSGETQDMLIERFEASTDPNIRQPYAQSLGRVQGEAHKRRALNYALSNDLSVDELSTIVGGVTADGNEDLVLDAIIANFDGIRQKVTPLTLSYFPYFASGCDAERVKKGNDFFGAEENAVAGTAQSLARVQLGYETCQARKEAWLPSIEAYLSAE